MKKLFFNFGIKQQLTQRQGVLDVGFLIIPAIGFMFHKSNISWGFTLTFSWIVWQLQMQISN